MNNDSTYNEKINKSEKIGSTYNDLLQNNPTYHGKDLAKINLLIAEARILWDKISIGSLNRKEKKQFATIDKKTYEFGLF